MEYKINNTMWGSMFGFPTAIVDKYIKVCSGNALKILLLVFKLGDIIIRPQELAKLLNLPPDEVFDSLTYWTQEGVLAPCQQSADQIAKNSDPLQDNKKAETSKRPRYTREEVVETIKSDKILQGLVDEAQHILKKTLTSLDMGCLVALYSYYGLSAHFIITVMQYCSSTNKRSMAYVEKTATNWFLLGVDDNNINNHIDNITIYQSNEGRVRKLLGISDRVLSQKEKDTINRWCSDYKVSDELLLYSYQITLENTGKVAFNYQDTILTRWHNSAITTLDKAKKDNEQYINRPKASKQTVIKPQDPNDPYSFSNIETMLEQRFVGDKPSANNPEQGKDSISLKNIQDLLELQFVK